MFSKLFNKTPKKKRIALFLDGPNILRKEFNLDLDVLRKRVEKYGRLVIAKVFVNQFAPEKLVEAILNQGFEPIIGMGKEKNEVIDVDIYLSVEAMEAVHSPNVDVICLVTRDADFLPLIQNAKENGKEIIVVGRPPAFSKGLQRAADIVIDLTLTEDIKNN